MEDTNTLPPSPSAPSAPALTIAGLRAELALSQQDFAELIGLSSKGNVSVLERGGPCSLAVALRLEELSGRRIDAAALNADVAAARKRLLIDDQSEPGSWAGALAHSVNIKVCGDEAPAATERVIVCDVCDRRVDDKLPKACTFVDCPHSGRIAA